MNFLFDATIRGVTTLQYIDREGPGYAYCIVALFIINIKYLIQ